MYWPHLTRSSPVIPPQSDGAAGPPSPPSGMPASAECLPPVFDVLPAAPPALLSPPLLPPLEEPPEPALPPLLGRPLSTPPSADSLLLLSLLQAKERIATVKEVSAIRPKAMFGLMYSSTPGM